MTNYTSQKIKVTSFILMIMVVFLHGYNLDTKQNGQILVFEKGINWWIQNFISNGLTRIAVPLFFIISGYLFFLDGKYFKQDFIIKIKKRIKTLLIPYLIWAILGILLYYILQTVPQTQQFFTKKPIKNYSFIEWINAIFNEPIPYQLWFLKDLIIMVFLSPIIYYLTKFLKWIYIAIVFGFWVFSQDALFLTSEALLFFSVGIYISLFYKNSIEFKSKNSVFLALAWILLLSIKTFFGYCENSSMLESMFLKVSILIGLMAFWNCYDAIALKIKTNFWDKFIGFSFFIYVFHEPALTIIKKGMFSILPKTSSSYLLVYFVAPLIIISFSLFIAAFLKKNIPFLYKILTGNR